MVALLTKLHALGMDGAVFQFLETDQHLKVIINGQESKPQPIRVGVPQGSCLGPMLWNVYVNNLLHLLPTARVYADDITLTSSYRLEDEATATNINATLSCIAAWGRKWQAKFATHKTQLLRANKMREALCPKFNVETLMSQAEVEVLV